MVVVITNDGSAVDYAGKSPYEPANWLTGKASQDQEDDECCRFDQPAHLDGLHKPW